MTRTRTAPPALSAIAFSAIALAACAPQTQSEIDPPIGDQPLAITCASDGFQDTTAVLAWRLDLVATAADAFDVALERDLAHPNASLAPQHTPTSLEAVATAAWTDGRLTLEWPGGSLDVDRTPDSAPGFLQGELEIADDGRHAVACWSDDHAPRFAYDAATGGCLDDDGVEGRNLTPVAMVRDTGDGQCVDFGEAALEEADYGYPTWAGFDLRGADLSTASIHFAHIAESRLEGARMASLDYGYSEIAGSIDAFTVPPEQGCDVRPDSIACSR